MEVKCCDARRKIRDTVGTVARNNLIRSYCQRPQIMCYTLKNLVNKLGYVLHEFQQEAAVTLADIVQELGECVDKVSPWPSANTALP